MIDQTLTFVDSWLQFLPAVMRVVIWGGGSGVVTMLLYRKLSSQQKIAAVVEQSSAARRDMSSYDGDDPREMMRRVGRTLRLSLAHLWLVSVPALVASLPAVLVFWWMGNRYEQIELVSFGPDWIQGWLFAFMVAAAGAALAIKFSLGIR